MWSIASLAVAASLVLPAIAAADSSGGIGWSNPPSISRIECKKGCAVTAASRARSVSVTAHAVVVVRGRNLDAAREVTFLGGRGTADDVAFAPLRPGRAAITVSVPDGAASGPLRVVSKLGERSRASATAVRIVDSQPQRAATEGLDPATDVGLAPSGQLLWPLLESDAPITSPFGPRWGRLHAGIDIGIRAGSSIRAAASGTVTEAGWVSGYGNYTCIAHVSITTCYAHQSQFLTDEGAQVTRGQVIGKVGCTGNCYGDHLHFEVRLGIEDWADPADPMPYLPLRAAASKASYGAPMDFDLPVDGMVDAG